MNDYSTFTSLILCSIPGHSWQLEDILHLYARLHSSAIEEDPVEPFFRGVMRSRPPLRSITLVNQGRFGTFTIFCLILSTFFLITSYFFLQLRDEKRRLNEKCSHSCC